MSKDTNENKNNGKDIPEVQGENIVVQPLANDDETEPKDAGKKEDDRVPAKPSTPDDNAEITNDKSDDGSEDGETESERHLKEAIHEQAREDERPHSSNFTLRKILGGDILTAQMLRNNIWLIILIVGFVVLYITNRYKVQKDLLEIDKLNTELEDAKYRALSSSSNLTERSRESHVIESLKSSPDSTLKESDRPPYIIEVPEK